MGSTSTSSRRRPPCQGTAWAEPEHQAELERRTNDAAAAWVAHAPDRFVGSFTLPLRSVDLALRELDRATDDLGLRVANLPAQCDGDYLGAPRFRPIWEAIAARGVVVFMHPDGARDPWFQEYSLWNSIGQPIEEAKLLASLILEGVLEQLPELRIVISHGGGFLPHYAGRLDRNVTNMPDSVRNISRRPSEYLRDLYYDTCVYDVSVLEALVERVGADRIVFGSDYPVAGEEDHLAFVQSARNLPAMTSSRSQALPPRACSASEQVAGAGVAELAHELVPLDRPVRLERRPVHHLPRERRVDHPEADVGGELLVFVRDPVAELGDQHRPERTRGGPAAVGAAGRHDLVDGAEVHRRAQQPAEDAEDLQLPAHHLAHEVVRLQLRPFPRLEHSHHRADLAHRVQVDLADEVLLVAEPRVDRADRDARPLAHLLDRQPLEAELLEQLRARLEHALQRVAAARLLRLAHGLGHRSSIVGQRRELKFCSTFCPSSTRV